jgi:hypothetical protein
MFETIANSVAAVVFFFVILAVAYSIAKQVIQKDRNKEVAAEGAKDGAACGKAIATNTFTTFSDYYRNGLFYVGTEKTYDDAFNYAKAVAIQANLPEKANR